MIHFPKWPFAGDHHQFDSSMVGFRARRSGHDELQSIDVSARASSRLHNGYSEPRHERFSAGTHRHLESGAARLRLLRDCQGSTEPGSSDEFLAKISKPQYQAEFTKFITYGPTNTKAYDIGAIDATYAKRLPSHPDNAAKQLPIDLDWYIKFETAASAAYQDMLTE